MKYIKIFSLLIFCLCSRPVFSNPGYTGKMELSSYLQLSALNDLPLDESDWRWLREKKVLKLGVSSPETPPYDLFVYDKEYGGMTADFSSLIFQSLGTKLEVYRYANRKAAQKALLEGEVDFLGTANSYDEINNLTALTVPYVRDQPVFVSSLSEKRNFSAELTGVIIAVVADYIKVADVKNKYPKANVRAYPSTHAAMEAVAFGDANLLVVDLTTANYLIANNYTNYLKLYRASHVESVGYSFAVSANNNRLKSILNSVLLSISEEQKLNIFNIWGGLKNKFVAGREPLLFTPAEQRWMKNNPVVRIDVADYQAPFSFYDKKGNLRGLIADLLSIIELRAGIKFEIRRVTTVASMFPDLKADLTDVIAGVAYEESKTDYFLFTRSFFKDRHVFVVNEKSKSVTSLSQLKNRRLAVTKGFPGLVVLREKYKNINLVETESYIDALRLVHSGNVDAAIGELSVSEYYLPSLFDNSLIISSFFDFENESLISQNSFAVNKINAELFSILDKVLHSIPPDEYVMLISRWQPNAYVANQYWADYKGVIYKILAGIIIFLAGIVAWNLRLKRASDRLKDRERALTSQLDLMLKLMNGVSFPVYATARDGTLLICNDCTLEMLGETREEAIGKIYPPFLKEGYFIEGLAEDYEKAFAEGVSFRGVRKMYKNDEAFSIYCWIQPYRGGNGEVKGVLCSYMDVTAYQVLFDDLKKKKENADSASRAKTTFLATMSHEIRTPMNAIVGMLELSLKKADKDIYDRTGIEVAYSSAKSLLELIGDILDIVRIEAGSLSLSPERCNLREQVESVVRVFDGLARQKGLRLHLELDLASNYDVYMDPLRFKQILSNVISNSIKFTSSGSVSVSIEGREKEPGLLQIKLQIKDTGQGISQKDQSRLFQPFSQAEDNKQSARSGTGLGLVISRTLCELMGGGLILSSEVGVGTEVEIRLTLGLLEPGSQPEVLPPPAQMHGNPLNVLIVDDHFANRLLLCEQLNYLGHQVQSADDGVMGLELWREHRFDVVITDCNMPEMNGYDMAGAIRDEERDSGQPPCVILGFTANAQVEERIRCKEAGMDDCLFKPVSLDELAERLNGVKGSALVNVVKAEVLIKGDAYNLEKLMQLVGGDIDAVQRLIDALIINNRDDLVRLMTFFDDDAIADLSALAHKIKGAAHIIQAADVISSCEGLEQACKGIRDNEILASAVYAVEEAILALEQGLLQFVSPEERDG